MIRLINKLKNKKGFTLIELVVVLAVLAVIIAIAVPRFMQVQDNAKIDADKSTLALIAKTAELYYVQGNIPAKYTTGTGALIDGDLLDDFKADFPGLSFQSATGDIEDVSLFVDTDTGIVTASWNSLTN